MREIEELMEAVDEADAVYIIVSNELGMGLVPANPLGREYRDLLGKANQFVAARADEVYFMMAGIPCKVK
jgi:adenosylcobinamide kinase/adenosylcobinamide-phosphate guanylyltransferase